MVKDIAGRALYLIAGIAAAFLFLAGTIERGFEMNLAYKNPAKTTEKRIQELKQARTVLHAQAVQLAELNKKLDIAVTGNARIEKKPDGTQVITGDKIEVKSETEKKTNTTGSTDQTTDQTVKTNTQEKDKTYPVLPTAGTFSGFAGPNVALTAVQFGAGVWITQTVGIKISYILDFKDPALDKKNLYTLAEIRF